MSRHLGGLDLAADIGLDGEIRSKQQDHDVLVAGEEDTSDNSSEAEGNDGVVAGEEKGV